MDVRPPIPIHFVAFGPPMPLALPRLFVAWLLAFYATWLAAVFFFDLWRVVADHWPIATTMAAGSYFAGSTPMGGGTVGFPVLVLLFDQSTSLGRDFSFAVQSIGMTSAAILILCRRQEIEWPMLKGALLGSLISTPIGVLVIAPWVPDLYVKLLFAVLWGSFGLLHLARVNEFVGYQGITPTRHRFDTWCGLAIGISGGMVIAGVTGVGIDMLIYTVLVLLCRADLRIAIATSVLLMAFTSMVGIATGLIAGRVAPEVFGHWIAAAPVVAIGAPIGALLVSRLDRRITLLVVAMLCVGQLLWTLHHEWQLLTLWALVLVALGLGFFCLLFAELGRWGERLRKHHAQRLLAQRNGH